MPIISDGPGFTQTAYVNYSSKLLDPQTNILQLYYPNTFQDFPLENLLSFWSDFNCSFENASVILPPSNQVSVGYNFIFRNTGDESFNVYYNDGTTLLTQISAGEALNFIVIDNSTTNGEIAYIQYGAGSSNVDAPSLAGYGLSAFQDGNPPAGLTKLNASIPVFTFTTSTGQVIDNTNRGQLVVYLGISDGNLVMPDPTSFTQGQAGYFLYFFNGSVNNLFTLRAKNTINFNNTTGATSVAIPKGTGTRIVWDPAHHTYWVDITETVSQIPVPVLEGGTGEEEKSAAFDALSPLNITGQLLSYNSSNSNPPGKNTPVAPTTNSYSSLLGMVGAIPQFSGLSILNLQSVSFTTVVTGTTVGTYTSVANFQVQLTPRSVNSKIILLVNVVASVATTPVALIQIQRNGTPILLANGENYSAAVAQLSNGTIAIPYSIMGVDIPNSNVPLTYSIAMSLQSNGTWSINAETPDSGEHGVSSIIAIEIGGFSNA